MKSLKKCFLIVLVIIVVLTSIYSKYTSLLNNVAETAVDKEAQISRHIDFSTGFIDFATTYGNDYLEHDTEVDSEYFCLLTYDANSDRYNLDAVSGTNDQTMVGNLTGKGKIPESGIFRDEVNLALHFNKLFCSVYSRMQDMTAVYYISNNGFINLFPWVSSADFAYDENFNADGYYQIVTPQNDPQREKRWTSVYDDPFGKGFMVTLSSPIYDEDTFMGVISMDLTNARLCEIVQSEYEIVIIDETDTVLAYSRQSIDADTPKFSNLLNLSQGDAAAMKSIKSGSVQVLGQYYIISVPFNNAPWRMFIRVPILMVMGEVLLDSLPMMSICFLLLVAYFEIEKRIKAEALLKNAAQYDFLTSTVNRRGLIHIFNKYILVNSKARIPIFIAMGDIDFFKIFNDTYGHAAGDKVLVEIAAIMQRHIKSDEVVCRWGGEEFVLMLVGRDHDEAMQVTEKIRREIAENVILWENSIILHTTMTFGISEYTQDENFEKTIINADHALYIGKTSGRNQVVSYNSMKEINHE